MVRLGLCGVALGILVVGVIVASGGGDPVVLLAMGPKAWGYDYAVELVGRDVATWQGWGHDGQFFFVQSTNPLWIGDTEAARFLNFELYRGQRMFFPLLVGLGGLTPGPMIPWMFGVVHVLAFGLGTAAAARLAEQQGGSRWWGLAFVANPAMPLVVQIGGAGVLALALALAGTAALNDRRMSTAALLFALSVLSREVMLLYCVGIVLFEWRRTGRFPLRVAAIPVLAYGSWYAYLLARLEYDTLFETNNSIGMVFQGIVTASKQWAGPPTESLAAVGVVLVSFLVVRALVRSPSALLAGAAGFAVLAACLGAPVWLNYFDITRATAPLFIAFLLATFATPAERSPEAVALAESATEAAEFELAKSS